MNSPACLAAFILAAQAAAPQQQAAPPVFPAGTDLVTVDVVVVDDKRQPVPALTREDFKILEDGQPREIATFEEIRVPEPPPAAASTPALRPRASSNSTPPPLRTFVIVFDENHLTPAGAGRAKTAIAAFLAEGTRPGDRVVIVPTASGRSWTDTMPEGRADLEALLKTMDGRAPSAGGSDHVTDWEALMIHVHRDDRVASSVLRRYKEHNVIPDCMPAVDGGVVLPCSEKSADLAQHPRVTAKATEVYMQSLARRKSTLKALADVMASLVPIKGRKSVLLVSEGFVMEPTVLEMHGVYDAARRANTAIHFVDVRGLAPMDTTIGDGRRVTQVTGSIRGGISNDMGVALDQPNLLAEGSDALAAQTGGLSFKNSNDLRRGLDGLAQESTVYYLLGYAPTAQKRDGRFRKIEVQVARPKTQVRARRGYVVPRDSDLPQRADGDAPPRPAATEGSTLPLRVAAFPMDDTGKGTVKVVIAAEADASVFSWQPREDHFEDALDTTLNLWPRSAAASTTDSRLVELNLPGPAREQVERTWLPIVREFELAPGVYQAQLAVRERNGGRVGSVRHAFEVPASGAFRITAPILTDLLRPVAGSETASLSPLARRSFARGSKLYLSFDVLNAGRDPQARPSVRAGHVLRRVGGATLSRLEPSPVAPGADGRLSRTLAISLRTATPGPHELVLTVQDDITGRTVETVEPFEVIPGEPMVAEAAPAPAAGAAAPPPPGGRMVDPRVTLERADRQARAGGEDGRLWGVTAALMMEALGRGADATSRLEGLAKQAPSDPDVLLALGAVEESRVDALAGRAVERPPAGSESLPRFQHQAARERGLKQAEARFRAVLSSRKDDVEARLRLGRVLQLRQEREAVQHLEEVARRASGEMKSLALLFLGEWHESAGQTREAVASYRGSVAAAPHAQTAHLALAQALLRSGDAAGARDTIEKGLATASGLDPFLTYERPALRLGSTLASRLDKEGAR
jgi:VWFA-related protein